MLVSVRESFHCNLSSGFETHAVDCLGYVACVCFYVNVVQGKNFFQPLSPKIKNKMSAQSWPRTQDLLLLPYRGALPVKLTGLLQDI